MALKRPRTKLLTSIRHCIIPDTQIKPNVPTDHLDWIAEYLCEKKPDVITIMGDWWDLCKLYENMRLVDYMNKRYPKQDWSHLA